MSTRAKSYHENLPDGAEVRSRPFGEFRATDEDDTLTVEGHAATFNDVYDVGPFREQIAPGAFEESIAEDDVRALFNHDPNHPLGRQSSGTLELAEDEDGLFTRTELPSSAERVREAIERGDVQEMSFGFEVLEESFDRDEDGTELRTIEKAKLYDVSPVVFPANANTDVALRSLEAWRQTRAQTDETAAEGGHEAEQGDTPAEVDLDDLDALSPDALARWVEENEVDFRDLFRLLGVENRQQMPTFDGTEDIVPDWVDEGEWGRPDLTDHPEAGEDDEFPDLPDEDQNAIRGRFIEQDGDTYADLSNPVVNPATDNLNRNGVLAARSRPASEAAGDIADELWETHFETDEDNDAREGAGDPDTLMAEIEIESSRDIV